ncbi:hypothetical protein [Nibricoccus sp. IMCC34717]|uniref:hypothetical protein n=1 Tax=Nibricoccus sp. IMCC34717 TaxID=3034021 RepID=UPI00384D3448
MTVVGCSSVSKPSADAGLNSKSLQYPYSEIAVVYDTVFEALTNKYFANFPDLDKKHTAAMREYITASYPKERFVEKMVQPDSRVVLERGKRDASFRESKEYKDVCYIVISVSIPMAKMIIGQQRDIYEARFVEQDPTKMMLFDISMDDDQKHFVAWVTGEVTIADARNDCGGDFQGVDRDRVFKFSSPQETWENLCGREGYIVVRDGRIVQTIVTLMN